MTHGPRSGAGWPAAEGPPARTRYILQRTSRPRTWTLGGTPPSPGPRSVGLRGSVSGFPAGFRRAHNGPLACTRSSGKLVIFGLADSSSWGNGHATLWRGLIRALARRGHRVVFFER